MTLFLSQYHLTGIVIGLMTFLIIGLYHPLVIKGEYYFGERVKWWFAIAGVLLTIACVIVSDFVISTLLGVAAFSSFWAIKEVKEQTERVRKGWFPRNPKRSYPENKK